MVSYRNIAKDLNDLSSQTRQEYDTILALRHLNISETMPRPAYTSRLETWLQQGVRKGFVEETTTGMLWWKKDVYKVSPAGDAALNSYQRDVQQVQRALRGKSPDETDTILKSYGLTSPEFVVKRLLANGNFDDESPGYFTDTKNLGDEIAQNAKSKVRSIGKRYAARERAVSSGTVGYDGYDDTTDLLTTMLMYDLMFDGVGYTDPVFNDAFVAEGGDFGGAGASGEWGSYESGADSSASSDTSSSCSSSASSCSTSSSCSSSSSSSCSSSSCSSSSCGGSSCGGGGE
jgi:hypothetical protein